MIWHSGKPQAWSPASGAGLVISISPQMGGLSPGAASCLVQRFPESVSGISVKEHLNFGRNVIG